MSSRLVVAGLFSLALVAGCGGSDGPTLPVNIPCAITLTGGVTATLDCPTPITAVYTVGNDSTVVSGGSGTTTPSLTTYLRFKGPLTTGTFTSADAGARGFVSGSNGNQGYQAITTGFGSNATGTWSIQLTTVTETGSTATGKVYVVHGQIDATMNMIGGGTAVTAKVTF